MCKKLFYLFCFVLVLGLVLSSIANAAGVPGLIGWWKFDGDLLDYSGLDNHGTAGGDPQFVPGKIGSGAIDLDGNDYVMIDGVADDIKTDNFALTVWIKTTQAGEGNVIGFNNSGSGHQFQFGVDQGNVWLDDGPKTWFPPPKSQR